MNSEFCSDNSDWDVEDRARSKLPYFITSTNNIFVKKYYLVNTLGFLSTAKKPLVIE